MSLLLQSMQCLEPPREHLEDFDARFWRCRQSLLFVARRIIGGEAGVQEAVRNCYRRASRNRLQCRPDGAFRSRLFRILIDEALAVRLSQQERSAWLSPCG